MQKYDDSPYHGASRLSAMEAGEMHSLVWGTSHSGGLDDKAVRKGFVRKVFGIVSIQLLITMAVCAVFMTSQPLKDYMKENTWPLWTALGGSMVFMLAMMCNMEGLRRYPQNYLLLGAFTMFESVSIGFVCMVTQPRIVILAAGITALITIGLTIYALQTKYDFTTSGGFLTGVLLALIVVGLIRLFLPHVPALEIALGAVGAFVFCCFLVVDIQMLMDGKRIQMSPDDYILASVVLYLDIINLFLEILRIISEAQHN